MKNGFIKYFLLTIVLLAAGVNNCLAQEKSSKDSIVNAYDSLTFNSIFKETLYDPVINTDTPSCVIPFVRAGNLILIKARVDSIEGNFILDTGAPNLVLNITYFRSYPTKRMTDIETGGITGAAMGVERTELMDFSIGTLKYSRTGADLINLGHLENSKNVKILGLLGMQLFKQCEMIIDYDKSLLYLHLIDRKERKTYQHEMLNDATAYNVVPIDLVNNKILAKTEMNGKKLSLMIDCGAESNLLDSRLSDKVFQNMNITGRVILRGSSSQRVEAITGDLAGIKMGDATLESLPFIVTNLEKTCLTYESCIDGILGFDFLSLHKVGFNFVNRKMYIWK